MKDKCPLCNGKTITIYGNMWDWDLIFCPNPKCTYEEEQDISTCREPDGSTYIIKKEYDDEDEDL